MKTTFNKTLVASAILAFAGAVQAVELAGTEHTVTSQYLASTGANHTAASFTITLGAEYTLNDTMTLTFTAPLASATATTLIAAPDAGNNRLGMTFSKISGGAIGDTTAIYRLTATDATGLAANPVTTGVVFTVAALDFAKANLGSGASVSFSAKTNTNLDLDTGGTNRSASLVKVASQFTVTAPSFARVIDVNADRKSFVDADTANTGADDFKVKGTFNVASLVTGGNTYARPIAGAAGVKHTVTGDFSWVVDNDTNTAGLQPKAGVFATTGTCANAAWTYSTTAVSLTCDAIAADTAIVIDPEANKTGVAAANIPVLPAQTFSATSTVTFTGPAGTENAINTSDAGSWTLNGATVRVPYLVMRDGRFGSIINVTNHGSQSGAIVFDLYDENGTKLQSSYNGGTATAGAVTSIANAVRNALVASGKDVVNSTIKYSLQITVNAPANDIMVYSAYTDSQNGGERAIVNNDSKVQTK